MTTRKNWTVRAAVLMLALVLITACFVGGTFAKYVTSKSGNDNARVAKFGVEITANGTMFAKEYQTHDGTVSGTITKSVVSSGTVDPQNDTRDNLVAPGTSGDMVQMKLTGTPEVAVKVTYDATDKVKLEGWILDDNTFYCPLRFKVGSTLIEGIGYTDAGALEDAIEDAINGYSKNYPANTALNDVGTDSLNVSWEWQFETGDNDEAKAANDKRDTYLGKKAADGNAATVSIEIATTVTQID